MSIVEKLEKVEKIARGLRNAPAPSFADAIAAFNLRAQATLHARNIEVKEPTDDEIRAAFQV